MWRFTIHRGGQATFQGLSPGTRTRESFYLNITQRVNVTVIALGEIDETSTTKFVEDVNTLPISCLPADRMERTMGQVIWEVVHRPVDDDLGGDEMVDTSSVGVRKLTRRPRRAAYEAIHSQQVREHRKSLRPVAFAKRLEELNRCDFIEKMLEDARTLLGRPHRIDEASVYEEDEWRGFDDDEAEPDLEEVLPQVNGDIICRADEDEGPVSFALGEKRPQHHTAVKSFMNIMMGNAMLQARSWKGTRSGASNASTTKQ
ncbi:hypothetical protein QBC34DRAFT_456484 [Podospora aff. communis PSN243]|uniref:Uncharacterized protein n=1 Tax=Podospora aff. communis PSN243 TaxID=3040156 RepID=A0AAV9GXM0_9PEZI|nr:hypothetical protein QBC34DRAFT_456484 [Podospora aff. communis PSN243]